MPRLTGDQQAVWQVIEEGLDSSSPLVALLHGVTGSGKTEIYLRAVAATLAAGRRAIVLVPEISLTAQTVRRFEARFPGQVAVMHSQLSLGHIQRADLLLGHFQSRFQFFLMLDLGLKRLHARFSLFDLGKIRFQALHPLLGQGQPLLL